MIALRRVRTPDLDLAYFDEGEGFPVILLHGFPDDGHAYDGVSPRLAAAGYRAIAPFLRGYAPTRLIGDGPRAGQQAAIGQDLLDLADALGLERFAVAGYDWGGRAAGIVAALAPERVRCIVSGAGYPIQNPAASRPADPAQELRYWYQWYFATERGRAGLAANRGPLCRFLWELWSPTWRFGDAEYQGAAAAVESPDVVEVVIHSYRHRHGWAEGHSRYADMEARLAAQPPIPVPAIILHGADDAVDPPSAGAVRKDHLYTDLRARRTLPGVGHFIPREAPEATADALLELLAATPA